MPTEIQRIARRHESAQSLLAELRIRAEGLSIHRPDPQVISEQRLSSYNRMARLTKRYPSLKFVFKDIAWLVIGDVAMANYGSSMEARSIDLLVKKKDQELVEAKLIERAIDRRDLSIHYAELQQLPDAEGECITAKGWPLCHHAAAIAWCLLDFSTQSIANVVDVMIGGLQINWDLVCSWLRNFGSDIDCKDFQLINESIVQDESVWGRIE